MIHNLDLHFYCSVEIGLSNARKGEIIYKFHSIIKKKSTLEIPQATLLGSLHNSFKKSAHKSILSFTWENEKKKKTDERDWTVFDVGEQW